MTLPFDFFVGTQNLKHEPKLNFSFSKDTYGDAQLSYVVPGIVPPPRTRVKLSDPTTGYFWAGYTWQPTLDLWDCSVQQCRGMQYSTEDNGWNEKKIWRSGTPLSTVVSEAISKCSNVYSGSLPSGLSEQLAEDSNNFGLQSARDAFNFVQQAMAFFATPLLWRAAARGFSGLSFLEMQFTDYSPRYRVRLTKNDDFKPIYDTDIISQVAMISWGNDQYATASTAGVVTNTPLPPSLDLPNGTIPTPIDYSVIPDMRVRRVRADNNVKTWPEASAMAQYLVERNKKLRPIGFTVTIDCNTKITAVPPVVTAITDNIAHYLVEPWHGIRIMNDLSKWGVYGHIDTFFIIGTNWTEDGKLQLTLGDPVQDDTFRLLSRYDGNKLGTTIGSGVINQPEKDVNGYPTYGPQFDAQGEYLNNGIDAGIPIFANDSHPTTGAPKHDDPNSQFYLPFGAGVHPSEIADYGVQGNFGREADSTGVKGFIGLIPVKLLSWFIAFLPPAGSDTIPTDSITIEFYDTYPFTPGSPFATKSVTAAMENSGSFTGLEIKTFGQGGRVGIRVSSAAATTGCGFLLFLGGRKLYPDLGVVS